MGMEGFFTGLALGASTASKTYKEKVDKSEELFLNLSQDKNLRIKPGKKYTPGMTRVQVNDLFEQNPDSVSNRLLTQPEIDALIATGSLPKDTLAGGITQGGVNAVLRGQGQQNTANYQAANILQKDMANQFKNKEMAGNVLKGQMDAYLKDPQGYQELLDDTTPQGESFRSVISGLLQSIGYDLEQKTINGKKLWVFPYSKVQQVIMKNQNTAPTTPDATSTSPVQSLDKNAVIQKATQLQQQNPNLTNDQAIKQAISEISGGSATPQTPVVQPSVVQPVAPNVPVTPAIPAPTQGKLPVAQPIQTAQKSNGLTAEQKDVLTKAYAYRKALATAPYAYTV